MNILFLTLLDFSNLEEHNIYTDLLRKFHKEGHSVYIISPVERKKKQDTRYIEMDDRIGILKLKIGNTQKTNIIEKGISTVTLEGKFISAIKKYFAHIKFDLVLYSTPPITLQKAVRYVKKRDDAATYLMLKDIFPQNAVDMGMLSERGIKGVLYRYFRKKEQKLYQDSDYIGCMSEANVEYVRKHNAEISSEKIELCPNCIEVSEQAVAKEADAVKAFKEKYNIPLEKKIFVYGGNLGKPQGVDFVIECVKAAEELDGIYILIVGSGTEYHKIEKAIKESGLQNTALYQYMPKEEYDGLLQMCDVGLIFLDYRFTIPNFPSRLLAYMDAALPVLAVVDDATDIGKVIEKGNFGWNCTSNDVDSVVQKLKEIVQCEELDELGQNAKLYLKENYDVERAYEAIMSHF